MVFDIEIIKVAYAKFPNSVATPSKTFNNSLSINTNKLNSTPSKENCF